MINSRQSKKIDDDLAALEQALSDAYGGFIEPFEGRQKRQEKEKEEEAREETTP